MEQTFKVGDRVRVIAERSTFNGIEGTITRATGLGVGVKIDGDYAPMVFMRDELEKIDAND